MQWIRSILREVLGLFVEDGSFAIAVLLWIGLVWLIWPRLRMTWSGGLVLVAGLALILIESTIRFARK